MIYLNESPEEVPSWELGPPPFEPQSSRPDYFVERSDGAKKDFPVEGHVSTVLDESPESVAPSDSNDKSARQNSDQIPKRSSEHVERQIGRISNHAEAAQPRQGATTAIMAPSPFHVALRGPTISDRVSAVEDSIRQVKNSQRVARGATGVFGIALLGAVLTYLRRHWLSDKAHSWFERGRSMARRAQEGLRTIGYAGPRRRECSGATTASEAPRIANHDSRIPTTDVEAVASSSHTCLATGGLREIDALLSTAPNTPKHNFPDTEQDLDDRQEIPKPADAVCSLVHSINDLQPINKLGLADEAWCAGFSRHVGPRDNQEDYAIAFEVGSIRVGLLADGAGGHPLGEYASYHGIMGAAASVARTLGFAPEDRELQLEEAARQAIRDASFAIAIHAVAAGIPQRSSLRSTLIVLLATDEEFAWANLGDGGGWTVRATPRDYDSFLVPAKGEQQHHLTSSLGPAIHGDISSGTRPWGDADFLAIASDGVSDIIDTGPFFDACLATCLQRQGSFSEAAEMLLHLLVESPDVTDNISIGFVGRRRKPVLAV